MRSKVTLLASPVRGSVDASRPIQSAFSISALSRRAWRMATAHRSASAVSAFSGLAASGGAPSKAATSAPSAASPPASSAAMRGTCDKTAPLEVLPSERSRGIRALAIS